MVIVGGQLTTVSAPAGPAVCIACPVSTHFPVQTELRTCPHCPAGYYQKLQLRNNHLAAAEVGKCFPCPKGKYSSEFGSELCTTCPAQYAAPRRASKKCSCKPQDCEVGPWVTAQPCSKTCGAGIILKRRTVIKMNNQCRMSATCPDLVKREPCNTKPCGESLDRFFT